MFTDAFAHYLSYGATDQQTVRDLSGSYTGLIVPGTVAAFQREGTGGFVLALSATAAGTEYAIDSRFPLFQQALRAPKRSHEALAELLGVPELVSPSHPQPQSFSSDMIATIGENWARFNRDYQGSVGAKFDKYAKRLKETVHPASAAGPRYLLPPYTTSEGALDPWWEVSKALFAATVAHAGGMDVVRTVSAKEVQWLDELLADIVEDRVVIWVSGLDELNSPRPVLSEYGRAIRRATATNRRVFALYGGFFSVLASSLGLRGSCHGIGYGEYRNWIELPQSGPPPARYYLPQTHRYVPQELAYQLWLADRRLAECACDECGGEPPIALEYHALMRHSVRCRGMEIGTWVGMTPSEMAVRLDEERTAFLSSLDDADLPGFVKASAERLSGHMSDWADAIRAAGSTSS